ncbi:TetR family transcriptional regulator [Nocardia sp. NPDC055321]
MAKRGAAKRPRRERGSLNPDDIIDGAFALAHRVTIDGLSMPLLAKQLDVGVASIYWYFRRKDELLDAMTERALDQCAFTTPFVVATDWRASLTEHARAMRGVFLANPVLCDLVLIRAALSPHADPLDGRVPEYAVHSLVQAGMAVGDAIDVYAAVATHIRGSVVLRRLHDKHSAATPHGHGVGGLDDRAFEFGLRCILDRAAALIGTDDHGMPWTYLPGPGGGLADTG